jgi:hypothetical protein
MEGDHWAAALFSTNCELHRLTDVDIRIGSELVGRATGGP